MPLRLMSALCILLLAGCTSSEPQNAYAPLAEGAATMPTPPQVPALHDQTGPVPPSTAAVATALQPGCHTVDNVTLCDAPADPMAEDTLYTN